MSLNTINTINTIDDLQQECAMLTEWLDSLQVILEEKGKQEVNDNELYELTDKVTELLTALNCYLRRFNKLMDSQQ